MSELLITTAIGLFVTIDPVGVGTMFAGLTAHDPPARRRAMAVRGVAIAALILFAFALIGRTFMAWLGISVAALQIAGGVLLFLLAVDMIFARPSGIRGMTRRESEEADRRQDISVFPLAVPLLAGPGAITSIILFMTEAEGRPAAQLLVLGVLLGVLLLTLVILLFAAALSRLLGVTGASVLNRVLGILLAALACQFVLDGIAASGLAG